MDSQRLATRLMKELGQQEACELYTLFHRLNTSDKLAVLHTLFKESVTASEQMIRHLETRADFGTLLKDRGVRIVYEQLNRQEPELSCQ